MKRIEGKRASGGNSWADAMFRFNADTKTYITGMLERVLCKRNFTKDKYEIRFPLFSRFNYWILQNNQIIIKGKFDQVEDHRRRSAFSYEAWLEKQIITRLDIENEV